MYHAVHRAYPDEHPELCHVYHVSFHSLMDCGLVYQELEIDRVVYGTVAREYLPLPYLAYGHD